MTDEKISQSSSKRPAEKAELPPHLLEEIEALRDKVNRIEGKLEGILKERK